MSLSFGDAKRILSLQCKYPGLAIRDVVSTGMTPPEYVSSRRPGDLLKQTPEAYSCRLPEDVLPRLDS